MSLRAWYRSWRGSRTPPVTREEFERAMALPAQARVTALEGLLGRGLRDHLLHEAITQACDEVVAEAVRGLA